MTERRVAALLSEQLESGQRDELIALCEAAFGKPFARAWFRVGPGLHVIASVDGRAVAHAMIVDRRIYVGHEADTAIDVGYVEHVATLPEAQGRGHATAVMERVGEIILDGYALGGLATRDSGFYARLGWEAWHGPTGILLPDGERVRDPAEDGDLMVLRTPRAPADLRLDVPVFIDWRAEEPW